METNRNLSPEGREYVEKVRLDKVSNVIAWILSKRPLLPQVKNLLRDFDIEFEDAKEAAL